MAAGTGPEERVGAREALLIEEIELRRHIERVADQRRALPPGGQLAKDFEFVSESGSTSLSSLFGEKGTLMVYSMMYGPQRKAPCPSCTSCLGGWNGTAVNLRERVAIAVTARSPIERLVEFKKQRGFANLPFFSDPSGEYTRTYVNSEDADVPGFSVFTSNVPFSPNSFDANFCGPPSLTTLCSTESKFVHFNVLPTFTRTVSGSIAMLR